MPRIRELAGAVLPVIALIGWLAARGTAVAASAASIPSGVPYPTDTMVFTLAGNGGNCNDCEWIAAEGPITDRTPRDFDAFIESFGGSSEGDLNGRETVRLSSNGGDLIAGLVLGEAIRRHKLTTEVGRTVPEPVDSHWQTRTSGSCYSACAYAFLGGLKRTANTGELGFHQFFSNRSVTEVVNQKDINDTSSSSQHIMGLLVIYLKEMAVDPTLLLFASSAKPSSLFVPDSDTMLKMGITNVRDKPLFSGWTIEPYHRGAVVVGKLTGGFAEDQQLAFFCRGGAPGKAFMLASWQYASALPTQAKADDQALRTAISGSTLMIGGTTIRTETGYDSIAETHVDSADRWFLTYTMSMNELIVGLKSAYIDIKIDGPHSLGDFGFDFSVPMTGLAQAARIAFKSCL